MKIGLLTFHCSQNYGASLQGYALQEVLKELGHDVKTIDYRPDFLVYPLYPRYLILTKNILKLVEHIIWATISGLKRRKAFNRFLSKYYDLAPKVAETEITKDFDAIVIGSDQIWNTKITQGDTKYFADFGYPKGSQKYIAYAASMEATKLSEEKERICKRCIPYFDAIGVRERNLIELIKPYSQVDIEHVADPVLLSSPDRWHKMAVKPQKDNYVLLYQVRYDKRAREFAKKTAKVYGAELVEISSTPKVEKEDDYIIHDATPEEFVGWIKYANCVVTSSYHGLIFSLVFEKDFYSLHLGDGADSRSSLLLDEVELKNRNIEIEYTPKKEHIDYTLVKPLIKTMRIQSRAFLQNIINN